MALPFTMFISVRQTSVRETDSGDNGRGCLLKARQPADAEEERVSDGGEMLSPQKEALRYPMFARVFF